MHPKNLSITDFTYSLPEKYIANYPLPERDASRLLIYEKGNISEDNYKNIAKHIPENALMLFNNTRVVQARLEFIKESGGTIEIFCLGPHEKYPDISTAMLQRNSVEWLCLIGGASKWKNGLILEKKLSNGKQQITLSAKYLEKRTDSFVVELFWNDPELSFAELLHLAGAIPLPPYIKRKAEASDTEQYQTIFAALDGSVAAPTAGLHFTDAVFESLKKKNIDTGFITLHVGAGTFKPVKSDTMEDHEMHYEFIDISRETIEQLLAHLSRPIVCVGTTTVRSIESLYWIGVNLIIGEQKGKVNQVIPPITQWMPYEITADDISVPDALNAIINWMERNGQDRIVTKTQIIIAPGYRPKIVNALVTNFHQPQSTLLLLVAALIGSDWKRVYDYALENEFRFLSYGDGCLLWC